MDFSRGLQRSFLFFFPSVFEVLADEMLEIFAFLVATPTATLIIAYATAYLAIMISDHNW